MEHGPNCSAACGIHLDQGTPVPCTGRQTLHLWATEEALYLLIEGASKLHRKWCARGEKNWSPFLQSMHHTTRISCPRSLGDTHRLKKDLGSLYWVLAEVHVSDTQWGQENWNDRVWSREMFTVGPRKETGGSCPKKSQALEGFWQSALKIQVRGRGVTGYRISLCTILWLVRQQGGVTGVDLISP